MKQYCFFHRIINYLKKDYKLLLISLCAGLFVTGIVGFYSAVSYSETIQTGIAQRVIRFHVIANSDTKEDQSLKLLVRDAVLKEFYLDMEKLDTKEASRIFLEQNKQKIESIAQNAIKNAGCDYQAKALISTELFPKKSYGTITFPAGMYDALRIEIGKAQGYNWWCVMFPPMCFVDAACEDVQPKSKEKLQTVLTQEQYSVVAANDTPKTLTPQIKFKLVEWWQEKKAGGKQYITKK